MKESHKIILAVAVLLIILFAISASLQQQKQSEKKVIRIGVVTPLSGGAGFIGQGVQKSIELAKEQLGDTKYEYEVIYEDDEMNPKNSLTAANKLINVDGVDAMISVTSGTGNAVSPLTEEKGVLHICLASDPNIAKGEYNFMHWTTPSQENKVFVEELQRRGIDRIAIIFMNQQGNVAIAEDLKDKLNGTGIEVVAEYKYNSGEKDFKTILMKAKQKKPDVYLLLAFSPELELIAKQAKELGITQLVAIEAFEFTEQPELFEGRWYVQAADATDKFAQDYREKYGEEFTVAGPNAYDAFMLLVRAYENSGTGSNEAALKQMENIDDYSGALGKLTMLKDGIIDSQAVVREVIGGKFVTVN